MFWRGLTEVARGLGHLVFPNSCPICETPEGGRTDFRHGLCVDCYRAVTHSPHAVCPRCAATVGPHTDTDGGCSACRGASLGFDAVFRLGEYDGRLRDAILRMKAVGGEGFAALLGRVFRETVLPRLAGEGVEVVVPVPLHWRRRWKRGHNQSAALGCELAAGLGVPFAPGLLRRVRHTPQQTQSSREARRENVRGAFRAKPGASLSGRTVLLVDDVMTTGSTAAEAARTLRAAGAKWVVVAVLARR